MMAQKGRTKIYYAVDVEITDDKYLIIRDYEQGLVLATYIVHPTIFDEEWTEKDDAMARKIAKIIEEKYGDALKKLEDN